jgi:6-phosphogluconolactonase
MLSVLAPAELVDEAAERILQVAAEALQARGSFSLVLCGGSTPRPVYERLAFLSAAHALDWSRVDLFWGDERCVAPDDPRSTYLMARQALVDRVAVPATHVHRMRGEDPPPRAATTYAEELRRFWRLPPEDERPARFDLVLLGLGPEGHTASLFPHSAAVREGRAWVVAQNVPEAGMWRLTLTLPVINRARQVFFLVAGEAKAEALRAVLQGPPEPDRWPAQGVSPDSGAPTWLVDQAAARLLRPPGEST